MEMLSYSSLRQRKECLLQGKMGCFPSRSQLRREKSPRISQKYELELQFAGDDRRRQLLPTDLGEQDDETNDGLQPLAAARGTLANGIAHGGSAERIRG
jgi:hypothetical protein